MTLTVYLATAMVLAPLIFVIAELFGRQPLPSHRVSYALVAAGLWPLLAVGLAQLALIVAVRHIGNSRVAVPPRLAPDIKVRNGVPVG